MLYFYSLKKKQLISPQFWSKIFYWWQWYFKIKLEDTSVPLHFVEEHAYYNYAVFLVNRHESFVLEALCKSNQ